MIFGPSIELVVERHFLRVSFHLRCAEKSLIGSCRGRWGWMRSWSCLIRVIKLLRKKSGYLGVKDRFQHSIVCFTFTRTVLERDKIKFNNLTKPNQLLTPMKGKTPQVMDKITTRMLIPKKSQSNSNQAWQMPSFSCWTQAFLRSTLSPIPGSYYWSLWGWLILNHLIMPRLRKQWVMRWSMICKGLESCIKV